MESSLFRLRCILAEADSRQRSLEREFVDGDPNAGIKLFIGYVRAGHGLDELTPLVIKLTKSISADQVKELVQQHSDPNITDYLLNIIDYTTTNNLTAENFTPNQAVSLAVKAIGAGPHDVAQLEAISELLVIAAQDPEAAVKMAVGIKTRWEVLQTSEPPFMPGVAKYALRQIASDPTAALIYHTFCLKEIDSSGWDQNKKYIAGSILTDRPWRFGDPIGDAALLNIARNPKYALQYAKALRASQFGKYEPWPFNNPIGKQALKSLANSPKIAKAYTELMGGKSWNKFPEFKLLISKLQ